MAAFTQPEKLKLIQKSLLDVHDGKGALLKLAGAAGAVCPMTSSCQSIEDKPSGSFLIIQLCVSPTSSVIRPETQAPTCSQTNFKLFVNLNKKVNECFQVLFKFIKAEEVAQNVILFNFLKLKTSMFFKPGANPTNLRVL